VNVVNLQEYKAKTASLKRPREITFFSPDYSVETNSKNTNITVRVEDGDVLGILAVVKSEGGISATDDDGTFVIIPWPCAVVEIKDV
jgi:hypothetical protein